MSPEWVTAIATLFTALIIAASAVAALLQIRHLRSSNQIAALNECRETIESPEFQDAERFVALELPGRLVDNDVQRALLERYLRAEFEPVRTIGNFFENLGIFVKTGLIDQRIVCDMWSTVILRNWDALLEITENRRASLDFQSLWENFEFLAALCQRWQRRYPSGSYPQRYPRMPVPQLWPVTRDIRHGRS